MLCILNLECRVDKGAQRRVHQDFAQICLLHKRLLTRAAQKAREICRYKAIFNERALSSLMKGIDCGIVPVNPHGIKNHAKN